MDQELKELLLEMQNEMKAWRADMNARFDRTDERMTKIEITLENNVGTRLQLLTEGQQGMNEQFQKLDQVAEDVEEIKVKVSALEEASRSQASQIQELRIAK